MIKSLKYRVLFKLILLVLTILTGFIFIYELNLILSPIIIFTLAIIQIFYIFYSLDASNKALVKFFESVKFGDDSINLGIQHKGKTFRRLNEVLETLRQKLISERLEKEKSVKFIQFIIDNLNSGIIVYNNEDNKLVFINKKGIEIFKFANNRFDKPNNNKHLIERLLQSKSNNNFEFKIIINNKPKLFFINVNNIISEKVHYRLVILEDLDEKLEAKEQEAWETLIRVLTHEIMNSMTPIQSLADTVSDITSNLDLNEEDKIDIQDSLATIKSRSIGLQNFVKSYRNMTLLKKPVIEEIEIEELFKKTTNLFKNQLNEYNIEFSFEIQDLKMIYADVAMIEQVLLNLILNAIDAVKQSSIKKIKLVAAYDGLKSPVLKVADSGYGIEKENLDKVFVPFFTTKRKGSGIGLNLCKQIMKLHKGSIDVESEINKGSTFILRF